MTKIISFKKCLTSTDFDDLQCVISKKELNILSVKFYEWLTLNVKLDTMGFEPILSKNNDRVKKVNFDRIVVENSINEFMEDSFCKSCEKSYEELDYYTIAKIILNGVPSVNFVSKE